MPWQYIHWSHIHFTEHFEWKKRLLQFCGASDVFELAAGVKGCEVQAFFGGWGLRPDTQKDRYAGT